MLKSDGLEVLNAYYNHPSALSLSLIKEMIELTEVHLPEMLSYYQLLGITDVSQLSIEKIRSKSDVINSLSVPIGKDNNDNIVYLDLHSNGDGPNGIIAGPPGTGKSEFLSTLCLSLSLFFSPNEIQLCIIDNFLHSKFDGLPHLGKCARLDEKQLYDLIDYINLEIQKRYRILNENAVENISEYLKERKTNNDSFEHIPHLIVILDDLYLISKISNKALNSILEWGNNPEIAALGIHIIITARDYKEFKNESLNSIGNFRICSRILNKASKNMKDYPGRIYLQSQTKTKIRAIQLAYSGQTVEDEYADCFNDFFSPIPKGKKQIEEVINLLRKYDLS